jgi:hypothetical protein
MKRYFSSPAWSLLLEHASSRPPARPGQVSDILDAELAQKLYSSTVFENSKYCVSLLAGCDGAEVCRGNKSEPYSVHPIIIVILLYSSELRTSFDFVLCGGIIPGPGVNNIEIFLRIIIDEVETSFKEGFSVYDVLTREWHLVRMAVVALLGDSKALYCFHDGWCFPAHKICHICKLSGLSFK